MALRKQSTTAKAPRRRPAAGRRAPAGTGVPVVAIGASAGGLDPISRFLAAMPADSGLAFVVIQHLDPTARSLLVELLAKQTVMTVRLARDGLRVAPNQVYVIPPGIHLAITDGILRLIAAEPGSGARMPIDGFLASLAADRGNQAVGVILSGTGTDGAAGLKALKAAGGLAVVQDPDEAAHDGMPRHAMLTASPDHVLPVRDMPAMIRRYVAHDYVKAARAAAVEQPDERSDDLAQVMETLRSVVGHNFEPYKAGTMRRRVDRRMALHALSDRGQYCALLRANPAEADALAKDLLIHVTGFFRDPETFAWLADQVLPGLLSRHSADEPVRVWVPGCSTGEEAYSIGILLLEKIAATRRRLRVQIFATDLDEDALQAARAGLYPEAIQATVSSERLERFFTLVDHRYKVANGLRQSVIFSRHDLLNDPAFSRLDLISCRNLFIYLKPEVQRRVLALFHFGLRADGVLFLGSSESTGDASELFEALDRKHRIYRRVGRPRTAGLRLSSAATAGRPRAAGRPELVVTTLPAVELARRAILEDFAPASAVVDRRFVGVHYFGPIDRYLKVASGEASRDVLSKARDGLRPKLRETIERAFRGKRPVVAHGVPFKREGKAGLVTVAARRIADDLVLLSIVDEPPPPAAAATASGKAGESTAFKALRQELEETRRELNRTIRDLEIVNEEMQAANEESMSMNEEFLSTNEELETSKEELQSLNEELTTVNSQLHQALEQQQQSAADLANLLNSSDIATMFLDRQLAIKFFNPPMASLFAVIDKDVGRPIADLTQKFADPDLLADAALTLSGGAPSEREVSADTGSWYRRAVLPYRTEAGRIDGVVITFADVSRLKRMERAAAAARGYAEAVVEAVRAPLVVLDGELRIVSANGAFRDAFHAGSARIEGAPLRAVESPAFQQAAWIEWLERLLSERQANADFELTIEQPGGGHRTMEVTARMFRAEAPERQLLLLAFRDVTEQRLVGQRQLRLIIDALPEPVIVVDNQRRMRFVNPLVEAMFGYSPEELVGQTVDLLVPEAARDRHERLHAEFVARPTARLMGAGLDIRGRAKDGREIMIDIALSPVATTEGHLVIVAIRDIATYKLAEAALRDAKSEADRANEAKSRFLAAVSHDLRQPLQTIGLMLGVLEKRVSDAESRATLGKLEQPLSNMAALVDTLLDIKQVESGAIKPVFAEFPVSDLLSRKHGEFAPQAAARGLQLRVVPSTAVIRSDPQLLERMLDNLLSNAIKYTERGRILLGCRRRGGTLRIEVWDTGIGISPDAIRHVFDEFYRADQPVGGTFGLGLGLYIVKRFAEVLGHAVDVRSTRGGGSMFCLTISVAQMSFAKSEADPSSAAVDARPAILLVEDDPAQRDSLRLLLELDGYRVVPVGNGAEAAERMRGPAGFRPDAIVADYNLTGESTGLQVVEQVRARWMAEIPALIVSGDRSAAVLESLRVRGLRPVVKPVRPAALLTAVAALVEAARPGWRPTRPPDPITPAPAVSRLDADVCVIDDEPGVRDAVRLALEAEGHRVSTFASAETFLAESGRRGCRCLVVDVGLPGMDGLALQRHLKTEGVETPIVFMTGDRDVPAAVTAMRHGAADFLQKPVRNEALRASVMRAIQQGTQSADHQAEQGEIDARLATLTARERQVLDRLVLGQPNKIIAGDLGISQRTVEHHRQSVMRKLAAGSLAMLVRMLGPRMPAA